MTFSFRCLALVAAAACSLASPFDSARAALSGFSAFTLTQGGTSNNAPALNGAKTSLTITTQGASNDNSAFSTASQVVSNDFTASFQYQVTNTNGGAPGDGFTFALQNESNTAVGDGGGSLGYNSGTTPVTPSVALAFDLYAAGGNANKFALSTGGTIGTYNNINLTINGGDLIQMNINYVASTTALTLTVTDTNTSSTKTFDLTTNVFSDLGNSTTGYVGFTGGSGANTSTQVISAFTFVPEPGSWAIMAAGLGLLVIVQFKRRHAGRAVS